MTDSERKKLFERARREVLRARTGIQRDTAKEILRLLNVARDQIRVTLASAPTDYEQWRLPQLQAEIERTMAAFQRSASTTAAAAASQSWDAGTRLVDAPLAAAGIPVTPSIGVDRRALEAMQLFLTGRIKGLASAAIDRINTELGLVILGAQTPGDAIGKVAELLGKNSRQRAVTIVRTEVGRAFSAAAFERLQATAKSVPGMKKLWRRSGKLHSRAQHDAIDGQVQEVNDPFQITDPRTGEVIELLFPRDPAGPPGETINCGCESLPYMESWESVQRQVPFTERELGPRELARNPVKAAFAARIRKATKQ